MANIRRTLPLWLVLAVAALLCWSPCHGHDFAEEEEVMSFVEVSNQPNILPLSPIVPPPQPSMRIRSGSTDTPSIKHKPVAVVGVDNRTNVVTTHAAAKEQRMMLRQISLLCVAMYGTIGCMWIVYWTKKGAADFRLPDIPVAAPEQVDAFYLPLLCLSSTSVGMNVLNKS